MAVIVAFCCIVVFKDFSDYIGLHFITTIRVFFTKYMNALNIKSKNILLLFYIFHNLRVLKVCSQMRQFDFRYKLFAVIIN